MTEYKATIGLEVHAELKTMTKMFCRCKNDTDEERPNWNICPICTAQPGTLPVINKKAVEHVLRVGKALGSTLADFTEWDRKNYFYPDIPKGYQISQYKYPLVLGGALGGVKLTRVHLEEDTGTSKHDRGGYSLIDFNRAGVPLMELVTEPSIHDAETAVKFAKELQLLLRYLGASDANMEKGEMRVEANVSIRPRTNADTESADERGLLYEDLTYKIRGAAFAVYNALGSGHKESVYQNAFAEELSKSGVAYQKEKNIGVIYNDKKVGSYQPDFLIDDNVIVEIKALPFTGKIEKEQLQYYLKNSRYRLGLIINFGSSPIHIERFVYDSIRDNQRSHPRESATLGTKVEVKNLNSFKSVGDAITFEIKRHANVLALGEKVVQETRGWDEDRCITFSQRKKESANDYRYFPEPDLPKLVTTEVFGENYEKVPALPELPWEKRARLSKEFELPYSVIEMYVSDLLLGGFFEEVVLALRGEKELAKLASNYISSDLAALIKTTDGTIGKISPGSFAALVKMTKIGEVSSRGAKNILALMYKEGGLPEAIARREGLIQKSDAGDLEKIAQEIIDANPNAVLEYKLGKPAALQFLIGKGMKATKGSANPKGLGEIFKKRLDEGVVG